MVRFSIKNWGLFFLLLPAALLAGEFTASVNRNSLAEGESLTLHLKLTDASPEGPPAVHSLRSAFVIHSQQQSSNTVFVNGRLSSSVDWHYVLLPKKQGEVTIPALKVETSEGALASNPITVHVSERSASGADEGRPITLTTHVGKTSPYKHEPFAYTVKLISKDELANVNVQKLEVEDAIVEMPEQPRVEEKIVEGVRVKVIEVNYLITPLKAGTLTLPPVVIQGGVPARSKRRARSFFDDEFSPFQMLRQFDRLEPFLLSTEEIKLEVKSPEPGISPWLPAKSVVLEESWEDSHSLRVGEPLTRSLTISAEGLRASQLPELKDYQKGSERLKVYADKPAFSEKIDGDSIVSTRSEKFTLIPQQPGTIELPEITLDWWDVVQNQPAVAFIPSKTIEVKPRAISPSHQDEAETEPFSYHSKPQDTLRREVWLYATVGILFTLLVCVIFWALSLQKRIYRIKGASENLPAKKLPGKTQAGAESLDEIRTAEQFFQYLQLYSHRRLGLMKNAPLSSIIQEFKLRSREEHDVFLNTLQKELEDALYRGKDIDCQRLTQEFRQVQAGLTERSAKSSGAVKETLPGLNP